MYTKASGGLSPGLGALAAEAREEALRNLGSFNNSIPNDEKQDRVIALNEDRFLYSGLGGEISG